MPIPFEALLPFGIMIGMFTIAGGRRERRFWNLATADTFQGGLAATKTLSNEGKTHRHGLDVWERQMMERDRRLTGTLRYVHESLCLVISLTSASSGQTAEPKAPDAFAVNSTWKIETVRF